MLYMWCDAVVISYDYLVCFTYCSVFKMCQISKQTKMHIACKNINQSSHLKK